MIVTGALLAARRRSGFDEENRRRGISNIALYRSAALESAHVDHAAVALKSIDRLMHTACNLASVSIHELQAQASGNSGPRRNPGMDPAEGALLSLRGLVESVQKLRSNKQG
jgi:hypothetical protein